MDKKDIFELLRTFDKSAVTKLKLTNGDFSLELEKTTQIMTSFVASPTPNAAQVAQNISDITNTIETIAATSSCANTIEIKSPMVGTFYRSPSPGAASFVNEGSVIKAGSALGIIEAMKIMNEFEAEFACKIVKILVEDGQAVEFDMPLFLVEKV